MLTDIKLQVYLPKPLYLKARQRAKEKGRPLAAIVRESLSLYLSRTPVQQAQEGYAAIDELVGLFKDDGAGASERHDEFLGKTGKW